MTKQEIANYVGVDKEQVVSYRETADTVIFVIDYGIAGSPKYEIPLSEIWPPVPAQTPVTEEVEEVDEPEEDDSGDAGNNLSLPVSDSEFLSSMNVTELKELAKAYNVEGYSAMRKAELVAALSEVE